MTRPRASRRWLRFLYVVLALDTVGVLVDAVAGRPNWLLLACAVAVAVCIVAERRYPLSTWPTRTGGDA